MQREHLAVDRYPVGIGLADRLSSVGDRILRDDMTRDGMILVVFSMLTGLLNYLYQLSMGILLTPEEFGTVFSLFSVFLIVLWFPQALQTPIAKFVSKAKAQGNADGARQIWGFYLRRTLMLGLVVFVILAALAPLISHTLHIDNSYYAVVVFASFILAFSLPVNLGVMRGLQRFVPLGFSTTLWAFLRLSIGIILIYAFGMGIYGGLIPLVLAPGITFFVTLYFLRGIPRNTKDKIDLNSYRSYTGYALIALICFAVATNIDVVLAKHYLSPENAGVYSAVSLLGKCALIAPIGITAAMFPKVSERFETGRPHKPLLQKAMLYVLLIGGAIVVFYMAFPNIVIDGILRGKYDIASVHLVKMGLGMLFFSLSFVFVNYLLSLNLARVVAYPVFITAGLQLGLVFLFHSDIAQFVNVILVSGSVCLAMMLATYYKARHALAFVPGL